MKKTIALSSAALLSALLMLSACAGTPNQSAPEPPMGEPPAGAPEDGPGAPGGPGAGEVTQGTAANTLDYETSVADVTFESSGDDENALRVSGASVFLDNVTINKTAGSSSNVEAGDFYGMNATLLATDGANLTIGNSVVNSSAQNGNGIFSYGEGTVVTVNDTRITTSADNSGGIQTAGGATTYASNLTVETAGNSSAAIRSDRGGGTVRVDGGSYTTNGLNSPVVYSTANISVANAQLTATNSEALVLEGQNSITLENCAVSGAMNKRGSSADENIHNVMIYQSMSGDANVGTAEFAITGGSLEAHAGDMFYITNTHAAMRLDHVALMPSPDGRLLAVMGNSGSRGWGSAGSNGAVVDLHAANQELSGQIDVDSISQLMLTLSEGSNFTGVINIVTNEQASDSVENNVVVSIDAGCTWNLTGDCTISELHNNGTINYNGYTITLANGEVLG